MRVRESYTTTFGDRGSQLPWSYAREARTGSPAGKRQAVDAEGFLAVAKACGRHSPPRRSRASRRRRGSLNCGVLLGRRLDAAAACAGGGRAYWPRLLSAPAHSARA